MNNNIYTRNNVVQGLEGYMYFWDQEFDRNTVRMGKCKISWPETEFDCTQEVRFTNILFGHTMWEFFARLSGIWELGKWAGKYRKGGEETLSILPLPFFHFPPYASTYWGIKKAA